MKKMTIKKLLKLREWIREHPEKFYQQEEIFVPLYDNSREGEPLPKVMSVFRIAKK